MAQAHMSGARLAYVVVEQEGTVKRKINTWNKKTGISEKYTDQPAGFLVYFPRGHVLRIKDQKELRQYKLHKPARIVNLEGLSDPNSPLGQMMMAQDETTRRHGMENLEKMVMQLAEAKSGKIVLIRDPETELTNIEDDD